VTQRAIRLKPRTRRRKGGRGQQDLSGYEETKEYVTRTNDPPLSERQADAIGHTFANHRPRDVFVTVQTESPSYSNMPGRGKNATLPLGNDLNSRETVT